MFDLLFQNTSKKVSLTKEEKQLIQTFFTHRKLRKKHYLLQEGDPCKYTAFVNKGMLRSCVCCSIYSDFQDIIPPVLQW